MSKYSMDILQWCNCKYHSMDFTFFPQCMQVMLAPTGLEEEYIQIYGLLVILSALQDEPCRLRIAHAHCLQFERSGMV